MSDDQSKKPEPLETDESQAAQYDHRCRLMEWHGHEALFAFAYVKFMRMDIR